MPRIIYKFPDKDEFLRHWNKLSKKYGWKALGQVGNTPIYRPYEEVQASEFNGGNVMSPIEPKMFTTDYYFEQIEYYLSEKDCHHENVVSVMSNFE